MSNKVSCGRKRVRKEDDDDRINGSDGLGGLKREKEKSKGVAG
jgi:hypothetical protein